MNEFSMYFFIYKIHIYLLYTIGSRIFILIILGEKFGIQSVPRIPRVHTIGSRIFILIILGEKFGIPTVPRISRVHTIDSRIFILNC